jgi:hypothetical protein
VYRYTQVAQGRPLPLAEKPSGKGVTADSLHDLLGKKQRFEDLRIFFANEVKSVGMNTVVRQYAALVAPGAAGALAHGVIHLGWAVDAQNADMIAEGILLHLSF